LSQWREHGKRNWEQDKRKPFHGSVSISRRVFGIPMLVPSIEMEMVPLSAQDTRMTFAPTVIQITVLPFPIIRYLPMELRICAAFLQIDAAKLAGKKTAHFEHAVAASQRLPDRAPAAEQAAAA
jgi:hypothetical protein